MNLLQMLCATVFAWQEPAVLCMVPGKNLALMVLRH